MADRPELGNRLHRIGVPVVIIAGECDRVFPPGEALKLARRLPQAQLRILPRTGHAISVERPAVAARLTDELLDRVQPAPFRG